MNSVKDFDSLVTDAIGKLVDARAHWVLNGAEKTARLSRLLVFKAGRFCLEFELARIVTNYADIAFRESGGRFRRNLKSQFHLCSLGPLQFHYHGVQDGIEGLHRPV
jgi:hypothetical protein